MAKTMKAMIFHNIKEVELLITAINTSSLINNNPNIKEQRYMLADMLDVLEQIKEMFLKETNDKKKQ